MLTEIAPRLIASSGVIILGVFAAPVEMDTVALIALAGVAIQFVSMVFVVAYGAGILKGAVGTVRDGIEDLKYTLAGIQEEIVVMRGELAIVKGAQDVHASRLNRIDPDGR